MRLSLATIATAAAAFFALGCPDAQADCRAPNQCVCADVDTVLDAVLIPGAPQGRVRLQVSETYGDPVDLSADDTAEVAIDGRIHDYPAFDSRALVYIRDGQVWDFVEVDDEGDIECSDANEPIAAGVAAPLALIEFGDCSQTVFEQQGLSGECDDTARCSVGGGQQPWGLCGLMLAGLWARRRR